MHYEKVYCIPTQLIAPLADSLRVATIFIR
jgi:hypothetical protein